MSQLTPPPKFSATYVDADGYTVPSVGYKLYAYAAGTSTPKDTYTSYTLGAANTNPVILDARGEADVWLSGNYKFILKTDADVTVWTVDNVNDLETGGTFTTATLAGALTVTSTAVTWSGNPTHSGNHTFSGNLVINGNATLGDSSADTLTVKPNAVTWTNNPTHSGDHTWSGTQAFNGAATFAAATDFQANPTGKIVSGTYTPTLTNGGNVASSTASLCKYIRVGDQVYVEGNLGCNPTAGNTQTTISISLPIASNFSAATDCYGSAVRNQSTSQVISAYIGTDTSNDVAAMQFYCDADASDLGWFFHFTYKVI